MALPDKITINGRDIPILEFMLCPCQTKEDLRLWIDMFLGINFPDAIIAEGSNSSPMDMIWWTYQKCVLDRESKVGSRALFMAGRSGFKTLSASVVELLVIIHGNRDVAHIGAIEAQAKRCYNYFTKYMQKNLFRELLVSDPTMQKSIFKSGRAIECLPCTISACNGPHSSFVCISGNTKVLIKDFNGERLTIPALDLYNMVVNGFSIKIASCDPVNGTLEYKTVSAAYLNGRKECLEISISGVIDGPLICTPDHLIYDPISRQYKRADSFRMGDPVLCVTSWSSKNISVSTIQNVKRLFQQEDVFDFIVQDNHNFFAGSILVHNCLDELDTVKDMQAYRDVSGIPCSTIDARPPVQIAISTRKTLYGLVQQEVDAAHLTNTQIFSWNIIDITKRCLDERSGTEKIPIYVNFDSLEAVSEAEWKLRPVTEQKKFQRREGFEGCLNRCKCFAACLGNLKNQTSDSPLLHEIDYAQEKIFSVPVDWANAQLLCRKPSTEGTIYPTFVYTDHVKSYSEMYEIFTGEKPARQLDFDMLRHEFEKRGMLPYMAVDFGEHLAAALLFYVDGRGFVYVVKEQNFTGTDDHELALWLKQNWGGYGVQLVFPDIANPSGIRLLIKQGFACSKKVNKDVNAGISTVRSFLRIPGTNRPLIAIHEDCKGLIWELPRYHRKKMPNEQFSEDPEGINDHSLDAVRYFLHTVFGVQSGMVSSSDTSLLPKPIKTQEGSFVKVPTAQELAQHLGRNDFADNSDLFNEDGAEKKGGGNEGPAGGGFQWSW